MSGPHHLPTRVLTGRSHAVPPFLSAVSHTFQTVHLLVIVLCVPEKLASVLSVITNTVLPPALISTAQHSAELTTAGSLPRFESEKNATQIAVCAPEPIEQRKY